MSFRIDQPVHGQRRYAQLIQALTAIALSMLTLPAFATPPIEPVQTSPVITTPEQASRLIVYYHEGVQPTAKTFGISLPSGPIRLEGGKHQPSGQAPVSTAPTAVGAAFAEGLRVNLPTALSMSEAQAYAAELEQDPDVRAVMVDRQVARHGIFTNDPLAYVLWNLEGTDAGTTHTEPVWPQGKGGGVTVAVLDTGKVEHPDMLNAWIGGYDLIADADLAGDGDARDADPTDTMSCDNGSGVTAANPHGLMVGSIIAARVDNAVGMAGVAPAASILPVRVISGCGGFLSDVLDGMRWAVGLNVAGVPVNPNPAKVLNLSLGTTSPGAVCSATVQSIVDEVRATGASIIVSTGNDGADAISVPASCQGVIAVTASTKDGKRADYANAGAGTTLSAAGGGCAEGAGSVCNNTSSNFVAVASQDVGGPTYVMSAGTSFSAPHVSAAAALLLERNSSRNPDQIQSILVNAARPFASGECPGGLCGAGMLDVNDALAATGFSVSASIDAAAVRAADTVTMTALASGDAVNPVYTWSQQTGEAVSLQLSNDSRQASFIAPDNAQTLTFEVSVQDNSGLTRVANLSTWVTVAPSLAPLDPITVEPGVEVRRSFRLSDGSTPDAVGIDTASVAKGIRVESNAVVWPEAQAGDHDVVVTPFDSIGSGAGVTLKIEVKSAEDQQAETSNPGGGGGALGLHGALLLMLAWIARRRLYAY